MSLLKRKSLAEELGLKEDLKNTPEPPEPVEEAKEVFPSPEENTGTILSEVLSEVLGTKIDKENIVETIKRKLSEVDNEISELNKRIAELKEKRN